MNLPEIEGITEPCKGLMMWQNPTNGFYVIRIHYSADKYKDPGRIVCPECGHFRDIRGWKQDQKCAECGKKKYKDYGRKWYNQVVAKLKREFRQREYEIDFSAKSGKVVFPNFDDVTMTGVLEFTPMTMFYGGWDFGTNRPAHILLHHNTLTKSFQIAEVYRGIDIDFLTFCDVVVAHRLRQFPKCTFLEGVDPQGSYRNSQGGVIDTKTKSKTPVEYMRRKHGLNVDWHNADTEDLRDMIRHQMLQPIEDPTHEMPWIINRTKLTRLYEAPPESRVLAGTGVLIDAFNGHAVYHVTTDGVVTKQMVKNKYSDPVDAVCYAYARAVMDEEHREDEEKAADFVSEVAGWNAEADEYGIDY